MTTDKTLTAKELALYLGCECQYVDGLIFELCGIVNIFGEPHAEGRISSNKTSAYPLSTVKPILRPLSDMTEEEDKECHNIMFGEFAEKVKDKYIIHYEGKKIAYLLSKHFDLFGWIEAGLAIDKTTLK